MGQYHGSPVADPVHKPYGQKVHAQLDSEIEGNQQRNLGKGDLVLPLEG